MNIDQIEQLTETEAKAMAEETMEIKGHTVYLVNIDGYFGYSAIVFKNGHQIKYANDYELHHGYMMREQGKAALRQWYIDTMNGKLFTEEELVAPIKDYVEYRKKADFIRNLYIMQIDYVTAFFIGDDKEFEKKIKGKIYNPISFCYVDEKDIPFIQRQAKLMAKLQQRKEESETSFEYLKNAFIEEMYNHEYSINWSADADTLSAFGNIPTELTWHDNYTLTDLFDALNFTDVQREAYRAARREYNRQINEREEENA